MCSCGSRLPSRLASTWQSRSIVMSSPSFGSLYSASPSSVLRHSAMRACGPACPTVPQWQGSPELSHRAMSNASMRRKCHRALRRRQRPTSRRVSHDVAHCRSSLWSALRLTAAFRVCAHNLTQVHVSGRHARQGAVLGEYRGRCSCSRRSPGATSPRCCIHRHEADDCPLSTRRASDRRTHAKSY